MYIFLLSAILLAPIPSAVPFFSASRQLFSTKVYQPPNADITQFYGLVFDEGITLHWITVSEWGNIRFRLERSHDGHTFRPLGHVEAAGHSMLPRQYSFTDHYPLPGNNYYRLSAQGPEGKVFDSISLQLYSYNTYTPGIRVFPNPFQREVLVQLPRQLDPGAQFILLGIQGEMLLQWPAPAGQRMALVLLPDLPAGTYFLLLQNGKQSHLARLLRAIPP